jgi:hypothetical protein
MGQNTILLKQFIDWVVFCFNKKLLDKPFEQIIIYCLVDEFGF